MPLASKSPAIRDKVYILILAASLSPKLEFYLEIIKYVESFNFSFSYCWNMIS